MESNHVTQQDGCMRGLMHLFHFNHASVPTKMITSKKTGGTELPQNRSKLKGVPKSKSSRSEIVQCEFGSSNASAPPQKLIGMPIRALVARDLSKGSYIKSCTSSVVARLMGLETSTSSRTSHKISSQNVIHNIDEKPSHKVFREKQCYEDKLPQNPQLYTKKGKSSVTPCRQKSQVTEIKQICTNEHERNEWGSVDLKNHPDQPQLEEFSKEFKTMHREMGHSKKSCRADKTGLHRTYKHRILYNNMHEVHTSEKEGSLNIIPPLDELKKVWDSTDVLQFDKEKFIVEMESMSTLKSKSNSFRSKEPLRIQGERMLADTSKGDGTSYQLPTRIVVLKPSTGKVRKLYSPSSIYARAAKDHVAESMHAFQRLRGNLNKDKECGHERECEWLCIGEHSKDAPKEPRKIAREIARQVRENVARMNVNYADLNLNDRISNRASECHDVARSSDDEDFIPINRRYHQNHHHRGGSAPRDQDNKLIMKVGIERKRNVSHLSRKKVASSSDETDFPIDNIQMRKDVWFEESGSQSSPSVGTSPSSKGSRRHSMDGILSEAKHRRALFHSYSQNNEGCVRAYRDCEVAIFNEYEIYEDSSKVKSHRVSVSKVEQTETNNHMIDNRCHFEEPPEMDLENVAPTTVHDAIKLIDEIRSISMKTSTHFDELTSATKSTLGKIKVDQLTSTIEDSMMHEQNEGVLVTHQEQLCQINDVLAVNSDGDGISCSSDRATTGADKRIQSQGRNTICEVDHITETVDNIIPPDDSDNKQCNILEETKLIPSSTDNLSSTEKETESEPNPVSVVGLCYGEEALIAMELKEAGPDLEDNRACLGCQSDGHCDPDGYEIRSKAEEQMKEQIMCQIEGNDDLQKDLGCISGSICSGERESEMLYVREILLASGFLRTNTSFFLSWYAPNQPLNPNIFETVGNIYMSKTTEVELGTDKPMKAMLGLAQKRLLFDIVNQSLFNMIGPHLNHISSSQQTILGMPPSTNVFNHVWLHVDRLLRSHSEVQDTLENLITEDMAKRSQWFDMNIEVQALGLEIESAIIDDLIEEILLVL